MITEEQAKILKYGDLVHACINPGTKCEVWKVIEPYYLYRKGWHVSVSLFNLPFANPTSAGICEARKEEWHLPYQCPPPSTNLIISIHREWDNKRLTTLIIPIGYPNTSQIIAKRLEEVLEKAKEGLPT